MMDRTDRKRAGAELAGHDAKRHRPEVESPWQTETLDFQAPPALHTWAGDEGQPSAFMPEPAQLHAPLHKPDDISAREPDPLLGYTASEPGLLDVPDRSVQGVSLRAANGAGEPTGVEQMGRTRLMIAAANGSADEVDTLLRRDADLRRTDLQKYSAMSHAAALDNLLVMEVLIRYGAPFDFTDHRPGEEMPALHHAAAHNRVCAIRFLLEQGAAIDRLAWANGGPRTPLMLAAECGKSSAVRTLLECGAEPGYVATCRNSALHCAARGGHVEIARELLARVDHRIVDLPDHSGMTALEWACSTSHLGLMELLIVEGGANVNLCNELSDPPMLLCARRKNVDALRLLLIHGASIRCRSRTGDTPLMAACTAAMLGNVRFILSWMNND